jgi:serine/threonine protein kinase
MDHGPDLSEARVSLEEHGYSLRDYIGEGHFAKVYTVSAARYDSNLFCVKIISLDTPEAPRSRVTFQCELNTLLRLAHPNIVNAYAHWSSEHFGYLVLEYCEGGSLSDLIKRQGPLDITTFRAFARQILMAVSYLHSVNFCHRDIKPDNILIDRYGRPRLADFGFARHSSETDARICGSLPYQAPELVWRQASANPIACDLWALGVTFYEMAFGKFPWRSTRTGGMSSEICSGGFEFPPEALPALIVMIKGLMSADPAARKSADSILRLPFFAMDVILPGSATGKDPGAPGRKILPTISPNKLQKGASRSLRSMSGFLTLQGLAWDNPIPA